jgi:hypothetical protein
LADPLDLTKPMVSHPLSVLKDAESIPGRREGQQICYSLNTMVVQSVLARIRDQFGDSGEPGVGKPGLWCTGPWRFLITVAALVASRAFYPLIPPTIPTRWNIGRSRRLRRHGSCDLLVAR